jgi:CheY-like chemotaxis protein
MPSQHTAEAPPPLIVAVEPDPLQANRVADVLRRAFGADVILADTADEAIRELRDRVPELILTSALLPPRDEQKMTQWLRSRGEAAGHVQTVTIPVLEIPAQAPMIFSTGRPTLPSSATAGACDPAMFADWVSMYLDLAAAGRASYTEDHGPAA